MIVRILIIVQCIKNPLNHETYVTLNIDHIEVKPGT